MDLQQVKQRFGIIGNAPELNRAIEVALQVAPTEISVLITGESGVGKEIMPQVIHQHSARKHGPYIAVNCGAIPEGTIDSELFGHEKGAFTGATGSRKGYFEEADGGTIFLDEVAELPLATQVRLLRVLETGEYIRVGSSKVQKTDVRIVAATNVNIPEAIKKGKFREDLFYRLSTVPIRIPSLRERKDDIHLLFRKFSADFAEKYNMPPIRLSDEAVQLLQNYRWPGNIRQLKNITEQMSVIEQERDVDAESLLQYLPQINDSNLPVHVPQGSSGGSEDLNEREILYKVLFDMKQDINEMKKVILDMLQNDAGDVSGEHKSQLIKKLYDDIEDVPASPVESESNVPTVYKPQVYEAPVQDHVEVEESLSLEEKEKEMIQKALKKHRGKRKYAAQELGISERTLYRKIKEYNITD